MTEDSTPPDHDVVIVGSGFAGLGMAIELKRGGREDFVILEKADEVGGTWRENTYPGCACDVQSHVYSFSFEPNPGWSRMFPLQHELLAYLRRCADKYGVRPHIRFGTEFSGAEYDDARRLWQVRTGDGSVLTCRALVLGMGPLHKPNIPDIPGLSDFEGPLFHSAEWDHGVELDGKRVGVIGTGASAIQFVPRIAPRAARLSLFQRTPPWILPKPDRAVSSLERRLFERLPLTQRAYRTSIYWRLESRFVAFEHPRLMRVAERLARLNMRRHIKDPELRRALTPSYTMGCKRTLISNDYYPALARPNVDVVTTGIQEVRADRVVTRDGAEHPVDAIVLGTGFHVTDAMERLPLTGRGGLKIQDAWADGIEAYLGTTVTGFPNLFLVLGPNTGLGHNSMVFMVEAQTRYIVGCLDLIDRRGGRALEVEDTAQRAFNDRLQGSLDGEVWSKGNCASWYLDSEGVNRAAWPGWTWQFWLRTRRPRPEHYKVMG
ncbi:flavin-containing monooxygenase [Wenjunlia tyrosinilytica]|uniref:4-hydroxyacetophenone monooxygenase n=1 Tax=Wenjunlia tyrosinilytica TaxID=1544741 RepID=A0A917ZKM9_9ACTN|nr:NAD(P)/FAD-dependent oxidoreductase [Wenjunlia tyrosinilytica]GGO85434.1 4-hydroxyacetophenone monooxygenase [Wenjunlia tyrosinilytica]